MCTCMYIANGKPNEWTKPPWPNPTVQFDFPINVYIYSTKTSNNIAEQTRPKPRAQTRKQGVFHKGLCVCAHARTCVDVRHELFKIPNNIQKLPQK